MPNREDVINGLNDIHAVACGLGEDQCYLNSIGIKQLQTLINDATELLKEQEPRVMTLEEAQTALHNDVVVWAELKGIMLCAGIRMEGTDYFTMQNGDVLDVTDLDSGDGMDDYGKLVRCWTSRPTDEQREATSWKI